MISRKDAFKRTALFVLVGGTVGVTTYESMRLVKLDPFARENQTTSQAERLSFSLTNIHFTHYRISQTPLGEKANLITRATVDRMDVLKDQQNFQLKGVHDGIYRGEQGEIKFSGKTAEWNSPRKRLDVTSGAHVSSKDFDLDVPRFIFDAFRSRLMIPGELKGKLAGGKIQATGLNYNTKTRDWMVGKTDWTGPLALMPQDDKDDKPVDWHVTGDSGGGHKDVYIYKNGYAESQDGDQIVKADLIEQNRKTKVITATGRVFYFSTKVNMTCDKVVIYEDEKKAVLTGTVNMIVKPKDSQTKAKVEEIPPFRPLVPDSVAAGRPNPPASDDDPTRSSKNLRQFPASVLADRIEYWYKKGSRHAIITGSPQAYQDLPDSQWRRIWTHDAFYDAEAETLRMNSSPEKKDTRMRNSTGDDMICYWIRVSTKEDDDEWYGEGLDAKVRGTNQNDDNGGGGPGKPPPGFDRAMQMPRLPSPTTDLHGGNGLRGPIGDTKGSSQAKPKKKHAKI